MPIKVIHSLLISIPCGMLFPMNDLWLRGEAITCGVKELPWSSFIPSYSSLLFFTRLVTGVAPDLDEFCVQREGQEHR